MSECVNVRVSRVNERVCVNRGGGSQEQPGLAFAAGSCPGLCGTRALACVVYVMIIDVGRRLQWG